MRFDIISIFPEFFAGPLDYGIVRRAREARLIDAQLHDLRAFTHDRHRTVDDRPFGGGEGMVMKPEPLFEAVESLFDAGAPRETTIRRSCCYPQQERFSDRKPHGDLRGSNGWCWICGRC